MKEFEISIPYVSTSKKVVAFTFLIAVLIVNIIVINDFYQIEPKSYAYSDAGLLAFAQKKAINVYEENDQYYTTTSNKKNTLASYECVNDDCSAVAINEETKQVVIYDNKYLAYDFINDDITELSIVNIPNQKINFVGNYAVINNNNKYALYDYINDKYVTEYIYDGITNKKFVEDSVIGLYTKDSKYNEVLDIYNDKEVVKHYDYCNSLTETTGYCSEHVKGEITNEQVDGIIDIVLSQYPDLNDVRLFTIKTGLETVGLPYFWGGGHLSLNKTLETATKTWNNEMCVVGGKGFKNQIGGQEYPCGFDCSGFVRWVYYTATGIDIMGDGVSVIGGRNRHPKFTQITEEELLPGDLIMDKDHVVIYLYKDDNGKHISVHAAFDHLKVEVSNYKRGNEYFRLNAWNE